MVRRLGLSPTVAAQIQRYRQAADKRTGIELDEVVSVLRLVGRRPDAPLVFADAGRRAARYAARSKARPARTLARMSPSRVSARASRWAPRRGWRARSSAGSCRRRSQGSEVSMPDPLSILALPDGAACAFYGSAYGELLRSLDRRSRGPCSTSSAARGAVRRACGGARRRRCTSRSTCVRPAFPVNIASVEFLSFFRRQNFPEVPVHRLSRRSNAAVAVFGIARRETEREPRGVSIGNCSGFRELRRGCETPSRW